MVATRQSREPIHFTERVKAKASNRRAVDFAERMWLSCNKPAAGGRRRAAKGKVRSISSNTKTAEEREKGAAFLPKFDDAGLLSAVVQHAESGEILMLAFMDAEALAKTRETGFAHFHSRSRGRLWKKGETSGHVLRVEQILVDCDQDALVLKALPAGPACHTGAATCFYRELGENGELKPRG